MIIQKVAGKKLKAFKDAYARALSGETIESAHAVGRCIRCKEPAISNCYSNAGVEEYYTSGLCEKCFDEITEVPTSGGGE